MYGFLDIFGSFLDDRFFPSFGSLGEFGFLFLNSSLVGHRLLKGDGSHTKFGLL